MPIVYGPVKSKKLKSPKKKVQSKKELADNQMLHTCQLCLSLIDTEDNLACINNKCLARWHILCIGKHFIDNENNLTGSQCEKVVKIKNILPVEGTCPSCESVILWGDLVRKKNGCYNELTDAHQKDGLDNSF